MTRASASIDHDARTASADVSRPGHQRISRPDAGRRAGRVAVTTCCGRSRSNSGFDLLVDVTCVDYLHYPDAKDRFGMVYLLANTETNERITVRCFVNDPEPTVPSVVGLWEGANWLEREVWDMFGIRFSGPPRPAADRSARGVHGPSAAEGLSAARTGRAAQFSGDYTCGRIDENDECE